jgi:hypothetical protein
MRYKLPPSPAQVAHHERVRMLPCIACLRAGLVQTSPTEVHHIKRNVTTGEALSMGQPVNHWWVIPLCGGTHHWNGVHVHISQAQFEAENGNEIENLEATHELLGYPIVLENAA